MMTVRYTRLINHTYEMTVTIAIFFSLSILPFSGLCLLLPVSLLICLYIMSLHCYLQKISIQFDLIFLASRHSVSIGLRSLPDYISSVVLSFYMYGVDAFIIFQ